MTKKQFMEELKNSLEGMVSPMVIQENLNYYENYINEQRQKGRGEQEILEELGSPRLIARSIIDAKGEEDHWQTTQFYDDMPEEDDTREDSFRENSHIFTINSTKVKIGCLLSFILFAFILYLLFHVFSAIMVFLGPVLVIGVLVYLIMNIIGR